MRTAQDVILDFEQQGYIGIENMVLLSNDSEIRKALLQYIKQKPHRIFVKAFLSNIVEYRLKYQEIDFYDDENIASAENISFACYLLGLHGVLEDCLLIWEAKNIDFDTYCGVDIQLMLFAGIKETMAYLQSSSLKTASEAHDYIKMCENLSQTDLDTYFCDAIHWFV